MSSRPLKRKLTETSYASKKQKMAVRYMPYVPKKFTGLGKLVRAEIIKAAEKKVWISYGANNSISTCQPGGVPAGLNLIPILSQGTTNSTRVGNEIRVTSAYAKGIVNILPYNATSNVLSTPVLVKIWLAYSRKIVATTLGLTDIGSTFFEVNSGNTGFQGNALDMILSPNKDNWVVLDTREFELGATYASSTGPVGTGGYFDNSKMSMPFLFDYGKHLSTLMYDDNNTGCTNKNLFLVFQVVYADGSSTSITPAEVHYNIRVEYVDV